MNKNTLFVYCLIFLVFPVLSGAETLHLRNGDVISGNIESFDEESASLKTNYKGTVEIDRSEVQHLTSDRDLTIRFRDGTYFTGQISSLENRRMIIRQDEETQREFVLDDVSKVFPDDPRSMLRQRLEVDLSGNIDVGLERMSGNTNRESYHANGTIRARTPENRYTFGFRYNQEETDNTLTEENALTFAKYDHFLGEKWFLFASTTLEQDTFQSLDLRSSFSSGLGYQFFETDDQFLLLETGISYKNETFTNAAPSEESFGTRYSIDYEQVLLQNVRFFHFQEGFSESGEEGDFTLRSRSGFRFPIAEGLQSTLQMNLDWDEEPAAGSVNTDRHYIFSLGYSF